MGQAETLRPQVRAVTRPALVWALHFTVVYAALAAACAERGLLGYTAAQIVIVVATLLAVPAAGWGVLRAQGGSLGRAAFWSGVISLVAILFNASPVLMLGTCG